MDIENSCLRNTEFVFQHQKSVYHGKVRDVYHVANKLIMVASDRISAFDCVLPRPIPYKGQVLNQLATYFLQKTAHLVPNWLESTPDPNVAIGLVAEPFKVEMVIRGYLAGHAWREYSQGKRTICGVAMQDGMKQNDRFSSPIITPTTKASEGHDEDISKEEILKSGLMTENDWNTLEAYTRLLFEKGTEMAKEMGLILVDTKYEFGKVNGKIVLIDEIHTPDSSRYFMFDQYESNQMNNLPQKQLSKEFVREWLIENNFQGKEGQVIPEMPDDFVWEISNRYIDLYEKLTGQKFIKADVSNIKSRIEDNINQYLFSE